MHNAAHIPPSKKEILDLLRQKAEVLLAEKANVIEATQAIEVQKLFHELQVHQLELEVQNDELIRVAEELEVQKQRFYDLFELAPVGYLTLDNRGLIRNINQTGLRLFGTTKQMLFEKPLASFVEADSIKEFYAFLKKMGHTIHEQACELRLYQKDRQTFYAQINGIGIAQETLVPFYYLTLTDITDKKIAEAKFEETKKTLDMALQASSTGIWEMGLLHQMVYLDHFSCLLLNTPYSSLRHTYEAFLHLIHEEDRETTHEAIRESLVKGSELDVEFRVVQEHTYVSARGQMVMDAAHNKRFIGTLTDISEKRRLEQEALNIKENQRQVILAASLKAEENERQRLSEVLHDSVGQMLYAVKLNLDLFNDSHSEDPFRKASQLLDKTIEDLRNIAFELAPAVLKDFGIANTLQEMAERLSNAQLTIRTEVDLTSELPFAFAQHVFRIVQELVNNGIKHAKASKITIEIYEQKKEVFVEVADNGKGFLCEKESMSTSGSGLSSIRNRLLLYKGKMDIQSVPNKGTKVSIAMHLPE